ncbi:hypothetical protein K2X85_08690 [bacterium]|nr:hypothetical protein [bacterium]
MSAVLVICSDLIFSTKIKGTAQALGIEARFVPEGTSVAWTDDVPRLIIDLNTAGTSADDLRRLRQMFVPPIEMVAFGSHVDVARLKGAREAGCDLVLPRSTFVERLISLIDPFQPLSDGRD